MFSRQLASQRSGFSLVEVMVAATILGLALAAAAVGLQIGLRSLDTARISTGASQMLQNEAERLRLLSWEQISALPAEAAVDIDSMLSEGRTPGQNFTVVRQVADVAGLSGMKEITITAQWTGLGGQTHRRSTVIHYARGGVHDYYYFHGIPAETE